MGAMIRPIALMCAFVVGWFFPQGAEFAWTIPWFVRFMLFMTFLGLNVHKMKLRRSHFIILALNILIGVLSCEAFKLCGERWSTLAAAALFTGLAPTATAAPAIASFLKREVEYVVTGLLLTTLGVAIALPLALPWALHIEESSGEFFKAFLQVASSVLSTIVAPIIAARLVRRLYPNSATWTKRFKNATFYAWVVMVTVISCRASEFIHNPGNGVRPTILAEIRDRILRRRKRAQGGSESDPRAKEHRGNDLLRVPLRQPPCGARTDDLRSMAQQLERDPIASPCAKGTSRGGRRVEGRIRR